MERELSLHVPATAQAAVAETMHTHKAGRIALRALYFDTASRTLARAGIALRIRREGREWVQTVKTPGHDPLSRVEINHPRPLPELDLSLYRDSPLQAFFESLDETLLLRYETDVQRLVVQAERAGSVVEIVYDEGAILANGWTLPVHEVEFELVTGEMDAVFSLAQEWLSDHWLILETRSKAQRGDRLADLDPAPAMKEATTPTATKAIAPPALFKPRRAKRIVYNQQNTPTENYLACAGECLLQIMANASLLAGVDIRNADDNARAEHLRQLRLGVRRLHACWKRFPSLAPNPRPQIAQAFARKRPEQLQAIAAGPQLQSVLLSLLKQLIHVGDTMERT